MLEFELTIRAHNVEVWSFYDDYKDFRVSSDARVLITGKDQDEIRNKTINFLDNLVVDSNNNYHKRDMKSCIAEMIDDLVDYFNGDEISCGEWRGVRLRNLNDIDWDWKL